MIVAPGSTIGIIGGGQLGRMLAIAAARLGYRCHVFDPHQHPCAADVAAAFTRGAFDDRAALERFAGQVDVATYEFENLPVEPLGLIGDKLRPGLKSLAVAQDRGIVEVDPDTAYYFLSRISVQRGPGREMSRWRKRLFLALAHNAASPIEYFRLPADRTVAMGASVVL